MPDAGPAACREAMKYRREVRDHWHYARRGLDGRALEACDYLHETALDWGRRRAVAALRDPAPNVVR